MRDAIDLERCYGANNYAPLPVVLTRGKGCHVWDTDGQRYLDFMSAYSAVSHGHAHPRLVGVLQEQAETLSVVSRAFHADKLGPFLKQVCRLMDMDRALPLNTGVEAVEAALKMARRWAYRVKGVAPDAAEVIACRGNFHGRSIAAVAMSAEANYRRDFGPFPPGFKLVDYGDVNELAKAITPDTAAFIVEPIQGEGGIIVPPPGYLSACAEICRANNILMIADEIQTGLGRTGRLLGCDHDGIRPDILLLGKALGGGLIPVSVVLATEPVMGLLEPGSHGSTFGGNPLAAAVGKAALEVLMDENLIDQSKAMGEYLMRGLQKISHPGVEDLRGRGLLIGMELDPKRLEGRAVSEALLARGILARETHATVLRFAPPLSISQTQCDELLSVLPEVFEQLSVH